MNQSAPPPPDPLGVPPPSGDEVPPPSPAHDNVPPASPDEEVHEADVLKRRKHFSWRKLGGEAFLFSLAVHVILLLAGLFWVVNKWVAPAKLDETFSSGAGGGANGEKAKAFEHKMKHQARHLKTPSRIFSKNANASVSLFSAPATTTASFTSGLSAGGMSKGFGGGSGGGSGKGVGIGKGDGANFVGRFLGMKVPQAKRVAVYLDASGSMKPYLDKVEAEAKKFFPEADVFKANGIFVVVEDGVVAWGNTARRDSKFRTNLMSRESDDNNPEKFSPLGKKLLRDHNEQFQKGSVGAWFDIMLGEKYDALILFSDFQDGFEQTNKAGDRIFRDKPIDTTDTRKSGDKSWETRWYRTLEKAATGGAPRVYCFSTSTAPQAIWKKCAETSGGAIRMVTWMTRPDGKPPEDEGMDGLAEDIRLKPPRGPIKPR